METIRQYSDEELLEKIEEEKMMLVKMKLNHAVSPIENPQKIKTSRRLIARLKTEWRSREYQRLEAE